MRSPVRRVGLAACAMCTLTTLGCVPVGLVGGPAEPLAPPQPTRPYLIDARSLHDDAGAWVVPPASMALDPILHSEWVYRPEIAARVEHWTGVFAGNQGRDFAVWMERMERYRELVDSTIEARGMPRSLRYLPMIESGYRPAAVSRAAAVGLWQFIAPVAEVHGMQVSPLIDERRDPVASTQGALNFLDELHGRFGSWFLALAAYNGGPNRVARLLREHAPLAPLGDSLFAVIAPHLPRETREYVPRFLAAARIAEEPQRFGIEARPQSGSWSWDEVVIPDATTLDVVAWAAGVEEEVVRQLNPQFVRGITPRGQAVTVRIPQGRREAFEEAWAEIPEDERITATEHVVAPGETLSGIAQQYGVRVAELQGSNPDVEPRRMRPGTRLIVPLLPESRRRSRDSAGT